MSAGRKQKALDSIFEKPLLAKQKPEVAAKC